MPIVPGQSDAEWLAEGSELKQTPAAPGIEAPAPEAPAPIVPAAPKAAAVAGSDAEWLAQGEAEEASVLGTSVNYGVKKNPDQSARVLKMQMRTGLSPDLIESNLDEIEKDTQAQGFNAEKYRAASPIVSKWLAEHPNNVSIAKEDISRLSFLERQWRNLGESYVGQMSSYAGEQYSKGRLTVELGEIGEAAWTGTITPEQRKRQAEIEAEIAKESETEISGFWETLPGDIANQIPIFGSTVAGKAKGALAGGAGGATIGAGMGAVAGAAAGGVGAVPGAIAGAATTGTQGAILGWRYGAAVQAARLEGGLALLEFEKLKDENNLPLDPVTAKGAAAIVGAVNGALEMVGFESIAKRIPVLRDLGRGGVKKILANPTTRAAFLSYAKGIGGAIAGEGGTEALQELTKNVGAALSKAWQDGTIEHVSWSKLLDGVVESGIQGAKAGGGMTATGGGVSLGLDVRKAKQAQANKQILTDITNQQQQSPMAARSPEATRDVNQRLAGKKTFHIPIESWNNYWQSQTDEAGQPIDPAQVAEEVLGSRKAYDEAVTTGGDIAIPANRYIDTIGMDAKHNKALLEEVRTSPEAMTPREAEEYFKNLDKEEAAAAEEQKNAEKTPEQIAEEEKSAKVKEAIAPVIEQLRETGVYTDQQVDQIEKVVHERTSIRSGLRGQSPDEMMKEQPLTVQASDEKITEPEEHVLEQAQRIDGTNVIDAFSEFKNRKESPSQQQAQPGEVLAGPNEGMTPEQVREAARTESESVLERFKARFGDDTKVQKEIDKAQNPKKGPYVAAKTGGIGWAPNFSAEPTGTIGPDHISQPNPFSVSAKTETDPLKWADLKYGVTKQLIRKHREKGIPLTINTSSDLIGHDDYIAEMGPGTTVRMHLLTENEHVNRQLFPGNPSVKRQKQAVKRLKEAGINVVVVRPTAKAIIKAAGGITKVGKLLGKGGQNGEPLIEDFIEQQVGLHAVDQGELFQDQAQLPAPSTSPIGFFSQVRAEVEKMDFKSMPAKDLASRIKNIQGIKAEELEHTGLLDWLGGMDGKISKPEVLSFLDQNGVQVEQIVLSPDYQSPQKPRSTSTRSNDAAPHVDDLSWDDGEINDPDYDYLNESAWESVGEDLKVNVSGGNSWQNRKWIYDLSGEDFQKGLKKLEGSYYGDSVIEKYNELREELVERHTEDGVIDEETLEDEIKGDLKSHIEDLIEKHVEADAESWSESGSAEYTYTESETGWTLQGNPDNGDWYSSDTGKNYSGNIEEAKIKLLDDMINEGVVSYDQPIEADDIRFGDPVANGKIINIEHDDLPGGQITLEDDGTYTLYAETTGGNEINEPLVGVTNWEDAKEESLRRMAEDGLIQNYTPKEKQLALPAPEDAALPDPNKPTGKTNWERYTVSGGKNYREILLTLPNTKGEAFTYDTHFRGHKNFVAHVRISDRVDAEGRKTLFVEELQSDWHQQGRERGYQDPKGNSAELEEIMRSKQARVDDLRVVMQDSTADLNNYLERTFPLSDLSDLSSIMWRHEENPTVVAQSDAASRIGKENYQRLISDPQALLLVATAKSAGTQFDAAMDEAQIAKKAWEDTTGGVPDAPFKNTDAWSALAMKRIIRLAAEQGYEAVAWTPGEVHVDRWGTDSISWVKKPASKGPKLVVIHDSDHNTYGAIPEDQSHARPMEDSEFTYVSGGGAGVTQEQALASAEKFVADNSEKEIPEHYLVGSVEQVGGNAGGQNIEEMARNRGQLLERDGERVTSIEELRKVIASTLHRERNDRSLESLTDSIWKQMQSNETGVKAPRKEGMEFFYDNLLPKKVVPAILKKLDKDAKVTVGKIPTGGVETVSTYTGPEYTDDELISKKREAAMSDYPVSITSQLDDIVASMRSGNSFKQSVEIHGSVASAQFLGGTLEQEKKPEQQPVWEIPITPAIKQKVMEGQSLFQKTPEDQGPRGSITKQGDIITLFTKRANLSTFLHESGHRWLIEMTEDVKFLSEKDPSTLTEEQKRFLDDGKQVLGFLGVDSWDQIGRAQHEKWARAVEAYLREGKAPSKALKKAFANFRRWLTRIYQQVTQLGVELNPEIRGVMDRLLATQEQIDQAQASQGIQPVFADQKTSGMNDEQWAKYQNAQAEARVASEDYFAEKLMADWIREEKAWWKEQRTKIANDLREEELAQPVYKAIERMTHGEAGDRLSKEAIVERYGKERLEGLKGLYSDKEGVHPDVMAEAFGFPSGDALLTAIESAEPLETRVERMADEKMKELHGDMLSDPEAMRAEAIRAVYNDKHAAMLRFELEHLAQNNMPVLKDVIRRVARRIPPSAEMIQWARNHIGQKTVGDIQPHTYQLAARKAAKQAGELAAKGDIDGAFDAKLREARNTELYRQALKAREKIEKIEGYAKAAQKQTRRQRLGKIDQEWLAQYESILNRFGFRPTKIPPEKSLSEWLDSVKQQYGEEIAIAPVVAGQGAAPYEQLSYDDLLGVYDTLRSIEHVARKITDVEYEGKTLERKEVERMLVERIRKSLPNEKPLPETEKEYSQAQSVFEMTKGFLATNLRPEKIFERLDGGTKGIFHDLFWNKAVDAQVKRDELRHKVMDPLLKFTAKMSSKREARMNERIHIKSLDKSLSRRTLIGVALNLGNDSNRAKMMEGGMWFGETHVELTSKVIDEMMGHLDAEDAAMVQKIWDSIDLLYDDLNDLNKRAVGLPLNRIEASPVTLGGKNLRGGYWPAVGDPRHSKVGEKQENTDSMVTDVFGPKYKKAATLNSFRKERTGAAYPLQLDWQRVLSNHVDKAITDISYHEWIKQARRLLEATSVKKAIQNRMGEVVYRGLEEWLVHQVAPVHGGYAANSDIDKIQNGIMSNTAVAALGLNLATALGNMVVAPVQASHQIRADYMIRGIVKFLSNPKKAIESVHALSGEMKHRHLNLDQTYSQVMKKLEGKDTIKARVAAASMAIHAAVDKPMTTALWLGKYEQEIAKGSSAEDARRAADKTIRTTQTAGAAKDLSSFERDPRFKMFKMFLGPMIIMQNEMRGSVAGKGAKALVDPKVWATMMATWIIPSMLFEIAVGRGPDPDDEEEMQNWALRKMLLYPAMTLPFVRDAASAIEQALSGKRAMTRMNPIADVISGLWKATEKAFDENASMGDTVEAAARAAGPLIGVPSNAAIKASRLFSEDSK